MPAATRGAAPKQPRRGATSPTSARVTAIPAGTTSHRRPPQPTPRHHYRRSASTADPAGPAGPAGPAQQRIAGPTSPTSPAVTAVTAGKTGIADPPPRRRLPPPHRYRRPRRPRRRHSARTTAVLAPTPPTPPLPPLAPTPPTPTSPAGPAVTATDQPISPAGPAITADPAAAGRRPHQPRRPRRHPTSPPTRPPHRCRQPTCPCPPAARPPLPPLPIIQPPSPPFCPGPRRPIGAVDEQRTPRHLLHRREDPKRLAEPPVDCKSSELRLAASAPAYAPHPRTTTAQTAHETAPSARSAPETPAHSCRTAGVIAADTSSRAGGTIPVVDGAAAAVASLIASPIPLKSADAVAKTSGAAIRKDDILGSNHQRGETQPRKRSSRTGRNACRMSFGMSFGIFSQRLHTGAGVM